MDSGVTDLSGLDRLQRRFARIQNPDPTPLLATFNLIIAEDNRKGVLAGLDRYGVAMTPVTYRPKTAKRGQWSLISSGRQKAQRLGKGKRAKHGIFAGFGIWSSGLHNNLSREEYALLDGPPLAPRRQFSRVITNLQEMSPIRLGVNAWAARAQWTDVVSVKGFHFLPVHFNGLGRMPQRDLRGVRPDGMAKARKSARAWMIDQIESEQP